MVATTTGWLSFLLLFLLGGYVLAKGELPTLWQALTVELLLCQQTATDQRNVLQARSTPGTLVRPPA